MTSTEGAHPPQSGIIIRHGVGRAGDLVQILSRHLRSSEARVGVYDAEAIGGGEVLEPFMHELRASDQLVLVHLVQPGEERALASELTDDIVKGVTSVDDTLRARFPALVDVDSWVLIDLGRTWSESARAVARSLVEVAADTRIRSVLAVTGSTSGSVAGDPDDRAGMIADAAWTLAVGDLGDVHGFSDSPTVWAIGSSSFTLNAEAWAVICTSGAVSEAIEEGPLRPVSEGLLDEAKRQAAKWVREREIGTDAERERILAGPQGDVRDLLSVRRDYVAEVRPEDWATAADREHLRLAGAPLARFTRVVEGNARAISNGRTGEESGGHIGAADDALAMQLRSASGCLRAARFINALSSALAEAARGVANTQHVDPRDIDVDRARRDLELAVMGLAKVRPWAVRISILVLIAAIVAHSAPWPLALVLPFCFAVIGGLWGALLRRRAVKARNAYIDRIERRLRALCDERLLEAQLELVKRVQQHVGAFLDDHGVMVDMEVAVMPPVETRAADVRRLWDDLQAIRDQFRSPESSLAALEPVPSCGQFFRSYPENDKDAAVVASAASGQSKASLERALVGCRAVLQAMALDWDREILTDRFTAACVAESSVQGLNDLGPQVAAAGLDVLKVKNEPRLDAHQVAQGACVVVAPGGTLPEGFESIYRDLPGSLRADSADPRRISVVWLAVQDFAPPAPKPPPPLGRTSADMPKPPLSEDSGHGFVEGGI